MVDLEALEPEAAEVEERLGPLRRREFSDFNLGALRAELPGMVGEAEADIAPEGHEKAVDHFLCAFGAKDTQRLRCAAGPALVEEVRHVGDVVGVHVREDGDVDFRRPDACWHEPASRAPTAVDKHVRVTGHYDITGAAPVSVGQWRAGAKKDDLKALAHTADQVADGLRGRGIAKFGLQRVTVEEYRPAWPGRKAAGLFSRPSALVWHGVAALQRCRALEEAMNRKRWIGGGAIAVALLGAAAGIAAGQGDDNEQPITGDALERASAAALAHTGGGRVTETEQGDEDSFYEVEVTLDDGSQVDVQLDESFNVVGSEAEAEGEGDDD